MAGASALSVTRVARQNVLFRFIVASTHVIKFNFFLIRFAHDLHVAQFNLCSGNQERTSGSFYKGEFQTSVRNSVINVRLVQWNYSVIT